MKNEVSIRFVKSDGTEFIIHQYGDWRFLKDGLVGFGKVDGDLAYVDNVMADGGEIKNVRLSRVDRTVKAVYMLRDDNATARREFTKFFTPRLTYKIYLTYMNETRWAEGTLYKMQMSEKLDDELLLNATMTFAFANPYWISVDDFGKDIASVMEKTGFPWLDPIGQDVPSGVYNFEREVNMPNDGDVPAYPRINLIARNYVENPVIKINDAFVKINDIMIEGDEIDMDFAALPPTIKKNGVNFFGHADKKSQFNKMYLDLGDNKVSFDALNGSDNLIVMIYYNKMYTVI